MGWFHRSNKARRDGPLASSQQPASDSPRPTDTARERQPGLTHHVLQPAGPLPAPLSTPLPPAHPSFYHQKTPYAPIIVNQHYYLNSTVRMPFAQQQRASPRNDATIKTELGLENQAQGRVFQPTVNEEPFLPVFEDGLSPCRGTGALLRNQNLAFYDQLSADFNQLITSIDRDVYSENEQDIHLRHQQPQLDCKPESTVDPDPEPEPELEPRTVSMATQPDRRLAPDRVKQSRKKPTNKPRSSKERAATVAASTVSSTCFAKVSLYANSRLPRDLPALRLYVPTFPLLCLAAQFSERAYERPRGAERETHFDADWRDGTKAMVIKSVPMDYMNTIVFAIRGTATFMDWVVNLNTAPASPRGFLDDPGNLCHAGFLSVARKMIRPVAARLRQLLEEEPGRASYSLLITGHSAGGAIASLLYSHLLSVSKGAESELNILAGCFRRIHCVTFGTPPVSLLPLTKPDGPELKKSLFLSFVNEGDPVVRADLAYVRSLLLLYASPSPPVVTNTTPVDPSGHKTPVKGGGSRPGRAFYSQRVRQPPMPASSRSATSPVWKVPPCVLSNAGKIVVLRSGDAKAQCTGKKTVQERLNEGVVAQITTDEQLRTQIWGDPMCHLMKLYAGRIETLAVAAVTARGI